MRRVLIKSINCALLIIVLIGIPAVVRVQFRSWEISSVPLAQKMIFCGLVLGVVANILAATIFLSGTKAKELCAEWAFIFGGLLFLEYAFAHGWLDFDWLKKMLQWSQKHF